MLKDEKGWASVKKYYFKTSFFFSLFLLAKVVIFLCYNYFSEIKADAITERIKEVLVDKNVKILWKRDESTDRSPFTRSWFCPSSEGRATKSTPKMGSGTTQAASPTNPDDLILLLKTRLRHGEISYDEQDVDVRVEGWTAPQKMADQLLVRWRSTIDAELRIYQNTKTGDHEIVVNKATSQMVDTVTGTLQSVTSRLPSLFGRGNTSPPKDSPGLD